MAPRNGFNVMKDLIGRLPAEQQSVATAELLQQLMGPTDAIANDARIEGARMIERAGGSAQLPPSDAAMAMDDDHDFLQ
jgi:hypothetical protein